MTIAIEGLDGSGKTTIAKKVSEYFKMEYRSSYLEMLLNYDEEAFFKMKNIVNSCNNSIEIRAMLFLSSIIYSYSNINGDVCFDRNIISEYLFDGDESTESIFDILISKGYYPDLTIILHASDQERKKRIQSRNFNDSDLEKCSDGEKKYIKMVKFAKKKNINYELIDSDGLSIEEVYNKVSLLIRNFIDEKRCREKIKCYK